MGKNIEAHLCINPETIRAMDNAHMIWAISFPIARFVIIEEFIFVCCTERQNTEVKTVVIIEQIIIYTLTEVAINTKKII